MSLAMGTSEFEVFYRTYHAPILLHLKRLVGQYELAEDLCQETFLKAMRAWGEHGQTASVRS